MKKTNSVMALLAGIVLAAGSTARAQTPTPSESKAFASISAGTQVQTQTFSNSSSFPLFNETATVASSQNIGRGFVFDIGGGYHVRSHFAIGVGVWTQSGKGAAGVSASLPDPVVFNKPKTVAITTSDLKQTSVGVNLQFMWTAPLTDKIDLTIFGGPTFVHVSQDVGSLTVTPNTQNAVAAVTTESASTGKAGNVGLDLAYRVTDRYGVGAFVRYAGGTADLPSVKGLKVGGVQLGIGARIRF